MIPDTTLAYYNPILIEIDFTELLVQLNGHSKSYRDPQLNGLTVI